MKTELTMAESLDREKSLVLPQDFSESTLLAASHQRNCIKALQRQIEMGEAKAQGTVWDKYKPGQLVYGIEYDEDDLDRAEVSGYLFMAECGDYLVCASDYVHCMGDFNWQLREMYRDSLRDYGVEVHMLYKNLAFPTLEEAEAALEELQTTNK